MKSLSLCLLLVVVLPALLAVSAVAQARPQGTSNGVEQNGFTWTETYEGNGNSDGFIADINSTVGYAFAKHFSMYVGVRYFFFQPSTTKTSAPSTKGSALDFSTSLKSAIPTASSAKGLSTGHVTVDWSNHFAHEFELFTPFVDLGFANSIPDTRFLHRPYISY